MIMGERYVGIIHPCFRMIKTYIFLLLFGVAFAGGLYHPHVLRTMRGEMVLSEYAQVIEDTIYPQNLYDPDTVKVPGLKPVGRVYALNICWTVLPPVIGFGFGSAMGGYNGYTFAYILGAPSLLFGPSAGLFYAGKWGHACLSSLLRLGIGVFGMSSIGIYEDNRTQASIIIASALVLGAATMIFDTHSALRAVNEHNKQIRLEFFQKLEQEQEKVGLGLSWRF